MIILFSTIHIKKRIQIYKISEISYAFARHFSGRYYEKSMIESSWAVILFRDVEHCRISSVNGTSSIPFPEFRPDEISLIPRNSAQFWNSVQFLQLQLIPNPTNSRNSGIQSKRDQTESELIPGAELVPQCSTLRNRMYSRRLFRV